MRRHRTRRALTWSIFVTCLLLAWVIYEELTELPKSEALETGDTAAPGELAPTASAASLSMPDRATLEVVLQRPVFSQSRRPGSHAQGGAQTTGIDFTLSGVVISGDERSALIRPATGGTVQQLRIGENVGSWTLIEVAADRVIVRRDTTEAEVFLDYAAPAPKGLRTEIPKKASKTAPTDGKKDEQKDEQQVSETGSTETEANPESGN